MAEPVKTKHNEGLKFFNSFQCNLSLPPENIRKP